MKPDAPINIGYGITAWWCFGISIIVSLIVNYSNKTSVIGLRERGGNVNAIVVEDRTKEMKWHTHGIENFRPLKKRH